MTDKSYKFYVGIDISKAFLDVSLDGSNQLFQYSNDETGLKNLIKVLPANKDCLIVMEATGGYERFCIKALQKEGFLTAVVNAKRVRDFAKAAGKLAKTDKIDAQMIRRYGLTFNPLAQAFISKNKEDLENNRRRRKQLISMLTMEKQHLAQANNSGKKRIEKHIALLEKHLKKIDTELKAAITEDPELQEKVELLEGICGIGEVTAAELIVGLPELGQLSPKEIAALAGVAPYNTDSGTKKGKRAIWGGRAAIRSALYMAALSARRYNPAIKVFYDRLITKGKAKKVALVACMRKLVIVANAILRDKVQWQPHKNLAITG
jgi:transposase